MRSQRLTTEELEMDDVSQVVEVLEKKYPVQGAEIGLMRRTRKMLEEANAELEELILLNGKG